MRSFGWLFLTFFLNVEAADRRKRNMMNGCEDLELITGVDAIKFPRKYHANFTRPWMREDAKLFMSSYLTYNFNWMKELRIRGLNSTVNDFMDYLDRNGCMFIIYGEGVKDIFLGSIKETSPLKIEGETTCDVFKIYSLCKKRFGRYLCGVKPTQPFHRVTFGIQDDQERFLTAMIDPIVVSAWNSTFNRPKTQWEFTANAVGIYDNTAGKVFLVDMTGKSVKDICEHVISMPVDPSLWKNWTGNNLVKVLRYYNLNADGFITRGGVRNFINREVRRLFSPQKFQEYYCRYVYDGTFVLPVIDDSKLLQDDPDQTTLGPQVYPECRVVAPDGRAARLISLINMTMSEDFEDFWTEKMLPALSSLNFVNIEERVFLDDEPTHASWPMLNDYDFDATDATTYEPTEEYPGDWKLQENEGEDVDYDNSSISRFHFGTLLVALIFWLVLIPQ